MIPTRDVQYMTYDQILDGMGLYLKRDYPNSDLSQILVNLTILREKISRLPR